MGTICFSSAQSAFIEHLLCAMYWPGSAPQFAEMKTIYADEHVEAACSLCLVHMGRCLIIACCIELREVLWQRSSWVRRLCGEAWGWTINICLRWVGQLRHALPAWFGREAKPSGVSAGQAAASVCASGWQGGPEEGGSHAPFTCGSFYHPWSQCVCTSLGTWGARAHPKPNTFPLPWENHFSSYFSLLKIFQYHNNKGRQWT